MTEWADPVSNPEQNAKYWEERRQNNWMLCVGIFVVFITVAGYEAYRTHRFASCIVGELPKSECDVIMAR
jgi:hypothetical protein